MILVLEYCAGGDVAEYLRRVGRCREAVARRLVRQVAAGLRAMRERNLVHRDLKPQNLLLVGDPDPPRRPGPGPDAAKPSSREADASASAVTLKIADFGFARYVHPAGMAETLCGSPLYMAPEILSYRKYEAKAELWSVGAILFELLVGRPPFSGQNPMQLLRVIERSGGAKIPGAVARTLSPECVALLGGLLRKDPVERMSFEEFFAHPFFDEPEEEEAEEAGEAGAGAGRGVYASREERAAGGAGPDQTTRRRARGRTTRRESRDAAGRLGDEERRGGWRGSGGLRAAAVRGRGRGGAAANASARRTLLRVFEASRRRGGPALVSACAARVRDAAKTPPPRGAWLGPSPSRGRRRRSGRPGRGGGGEARGAATEALPGTDLLEGTDAEGPTRTSSSTRALGWSATTKRRRKAATKRRRSRTRTRARSPRRRRRRPALPARAAPLAGDSVVGASPRGGDHADAAAEFGTAGAARTPRPRRRRRSRPPRRRSPPPARGGGGGAAKGGGRRGGRAGREAATSERRGGGGGRREEPRGVRGGEAASRAPAGLREDEKRKSRTLLPDGAALAYEAALARARGRGGGAVGNAAAAADAYAAAETLLAFVRSEGAAFGRRAGEEDRLDERRAGERGGEGGGAGDAALAKLFAAVAARRNACRRAEE